MKLLKRSLCLLMVAVMALGLIACGGNTQNDPPSSSDTTSWRPDPEQKVEEEKDKDTDGVFEYKTVDWAGPDGYTIVIPAGDSEAKKSAEYLQKYYSEVHKKTLKIATDAAAETDKEILIGKTKRSQSNKDMAEADLEVSIKDGKLVFDGGHHVTVDSAVRKFARKLPAPGKAITFKLTTDFTSKATTEGLAGDYYYVWGDEFEDADINYSKWDFNMNMSGSPKNQVSWENGNIDVSDGRLNIYAIRHFNPKREGTQFSSPYSTTHAGHMNFIYGYAEIRAKVPFEEGLWPSWWGLSGSAGLADATEPGKYRQQVYDVEVDIFEIFGSDDSVVCNIHKWYKSDYNYGAENGLEQGGNHTQWNKVKHNYVYSEPSNLDNEYHIYGYEWLDDECSMWVDGKKYMTFDLSKSYDLNKNMQGFDDPIYFMFNMHVFVDDAEYQPNLINENLKALPGHYAIDYYRVYQKKDSKSRIWTSETGLHDSSFYTGRDNPWKPEE